MAQIFRRAESPYESARFPLRGLESAGRYAVTNLDEPAASREYTGRELREIAAHFLHHLAAFGAALR
jgi:hypothetical protein